MTRRTAVNIFDGHNDLAYQLWRRGDYKGAAFLNNDEAVLSITAHKATAGGLRAGLFALFVPQTGVMAEEADFFFLHRWRRRIFFHRSIG